MTNPTHDQPMLLPAMPAADQSYFRVRLIRLFWLTLWLPSTPERGTEPFWGPCAGKETSR